MPIIRCGTGDSPRGHGGRRVTAAAGWMVESSQTEESTETATTVPLPGTVPAVADTGEMRWAVAGKKRPLYGREVHGTCSENPDDFIGIRIIRCGTGDSPRGHGGRRVTAAAGWTVESSQTEESTETATTALLPGTVPAVADTGEMRWAVAGKKRSLYGPEVHGTCSDAAPVIRP